MAKLHKTKYHIFLSVQLLHRCEILEKYETRSKRFATKMYFKETMKFNVPSTYADISLQIKVYQNTGNDEEIGHILVGPQGHLTGVHHWKQTFNHPNTPISVCHKLTSTVRLPKGFLRSL
ncbi:unnamed protein product [Thelazia callipaeda]|uniref:C2 domain-containing protein n=1 Tax=Thelazia callipaeda TaxID=103827 RepID=A0A0N5D6E2_THECL|nr:unnamed protein product [Thelazia callipaeda]